MQPTMGEDDAKPAKDDVFGRARERIEGRGPPTVEDEAAPTEKLPPPGPHAKPELVNKMATPGTGALPDPNEDEVDATTG